MLKKFFKVILTVISIVVLFTIIDLFCIFTIEDIINNLNLVGIYKDGRSKMYTSIPNDYNLDIYDYNILKCNKINGTKDIYIGSSVMKYETGFCE